MRPAIIASTLVLAFSCSKGATHSQEPSPPPEEAAEASEASSSDEWEEKTEEAKLMHERFLAVNAIRDAVIDGDLDLAKKRSQALVDNKDLLNVFADWGPSTKKMKTAIGQVAVSADLPSASVQLAVAARACGRCHESTGVATLEDESGQPPVQTSDIGGIMRQHHWAIGRMWDGLVAPSDISWRNGANALAAIATQAQQAPEAKKHAELPALLSEVEKLAKEAATSVTNPEKTQIFGQLLTSCSGCHQMMRTDAPATE